jgi:hypothetical protein
MSTEQPGTGQPNEDMIRNEAYNLWQQAGSPAGREQEFWHQAREKLTDRLTDLDKAGEDSFPASDPVNNM